ncbi:nitroreductase family protein [Methylobacterium radiotolerans]|jgi:nitroreductase|uniref:Putative NAD(P)H nitroreductase n=1 Tax=Methylobacterium radiotolerans (strain ATCC 27329 / DSM 1819 / JCM 2831 / NBRC 15690 / NCIMB 10815 / 0-1) TaxID=426355 RepID=B1LS44_METRJ|nr:nitroreductase [Methylobacterium radiotolerans]ACB22292.1 nitroreductase [Methylobacterium radiotolerans JCM 2831]GEM95572.1 nitroreductase [Methylobacterium radiotolerans]
MTATLDLLKTRRSVPPALLDEPGPDRAQLDTILTAAARVPDHGKLAPWRFIVIAGDARAKVGEVIAAAFAADNPDAGSERLAQERARLTHAPVAIAVVSRAGPHVKIPEWEQVLSAGAATMNLLIAANAAGFATSWLTEWFAYDRRVLDALGLAPTEKLAGFVHIGRAREVPSDRPRPALDEIVTYL